VKGLAIVTGAREEGLTAAEGLLRAGWRVSLWDAEGGLEGADVRQVNIADEAQVRAVYAAVTAELGVPDALVNFAQLKNSFMLGERGQRNEVAGFWELEASKARAMFEVNMLGTYLCTALVARDMVKRRSGVIINLCTGPGTQRDPGHIPYGATMAFVEAFTEAIRTQLAPHGVTARVITSQGHANRRGQANPAYRPHDWMVEPILDILNERVTAC